MRLWTERYLGTHLILAVRIFRYVYFRSLLRVHFSQRMNIFLKCWSQMNYSQRSVRVQSGQYAIMESWIQLNVEYSWSHLQIHEWEQGCSESFPKQVQQSFQLKRKTADDYHFQMHGCNSILSERIDSPNDVHEKFRLQKIKKPRRDYQKYYQTAWETRHGGDKHPSPASFVGLLRRCQKWSASFQKNSTLKMRLLELLSKSWLSMVTPPQMR